MEEALVLGGVVSFCEGFLLRCVLEVFEVSRGSDRLIAESIVAEEGVVHRSL